VYSFWARIRRTMPMALEQRTSDESGARRSRLRRFAPVAVVIVAMVAVFASGVHRHVSLETLVRHRMAIDAFMAHHMIAALGVFVAIYIMVVALSIPGALFLTITGGVLFGTLIGGAASVVGATVGATVIFLVARSACGETLIRRAGPLACKLAEGFRADAFSYLLFLRFVPAFPFFLVNLVPAVAGVKLRTFMAATAIGIVPATFAFAFFGSGLDSVLGAAHRMSDQLRHRHDRHTATARGVCGARCTRARPRLGEAAARASCALEPGPTHLNIREGAWPSC
jgi:uncharacterized membrane protein YdjX (TVP38/TMEM64 family)